MSLLEAPAYDERKARLQKNVIIGVLATVAVLIIATLAGYISGHGWLFTNLPAEHDVDQFFLALEAKDYDKAFAIYNNDPAWKSHPQKYSGYPEKDFITDWTTQSPIKQPITAHKVDISRTDGSGTFGTGIIVAVRLNGQKEFMLYNKSDHTLTWPAQHELVYEP